MKKLALAIALLFACISAPSMAQTFAKGSITRPANTTTYTANTGWNATTASYFTLLGACNSAGENILIPEIDIWSSANPTTKLQGVLWLFQAVPATLIADNATFNIATADFANLTGGATNGLPFTLATAQASGAANSGFSIVGTNYMAQCAPGVTAIYAMVQVVNAYVPASGEVLTIELRGVRLIP